MFLRVWLVYCTFIAKKEPAGTTVILSQNKSYPWMFLLISLAALIILYLISIAYFEYTYQSMIDGRQLEISCFEFFAAGGAYLFILIYKRLGACFADGVATWQHQRYPISLRCENLKAHFAFNTKLSFRG
jgi:hypothetical protein